MTNVRLVYLLGGNSVRFNGNKLLQQINNKPLFQHGFDILKSIVEKHDNYSLYVVTQHIDIYKSLQSSQRIHIFFEESCKNGLSYTIKNAIKHFDDQEAYNVFMVGDQPFIKSETIEKLIQGTIEANAPVGTTSYNNHFANPKIFHSSLQSMFLELQGDEGGNRIFKKYLDKAYILEIDNKHEFYDIDTKEDLKNIQ